jgi:dUTP pyrophosphatase
MKADNIKVLIKRAEGGFPPLPAYQTEFSAGADLYAAEASVINPGEWRAVPTGICIAMPEGYEAQIRPRSGLAAKFGVTTLNAPGTIDADYRGQIHVILINHGKDPFNIKPGDRIAQMVLAKTERIQWEETDELPESKRGTGGFGSTGV